MLEDNVSPLVRTASEPLHTQPEADLLLPLRALLFGNLRRLRELPALPDLIAALEGLALGTRRKALLPLHDTPVELALLRRGPNVVIDCYGTDSMPELWFRERALGLRQLIDTCARVSQRVAAQSRDLAARSALGQLGEQLHGLSLQPDPHARLLPVRCSGGSLKSPGERVPLAFGFDAEIEPSVDPAPESHAFADVHALLFPGTLWAFAHGRQLNVLQGPIALAAQCMVGAVRALCDAWQSERNLNVTLRCSGFWVAVGRDRDRGGSVTLRLGGGRGEALSWPGLSVREAALPILRLSSDLMRKLVAADRRQIHNLRLSALRAEIRALRGIIRARERLQSFENRDPERLRASAEQPYALASGAQDAGDRPQPTALRYTERWNAQLDGLDASAVYLSGERVVAATQKLTLAIDRSSGEVAWTLPTAGATSLLAGRVLLRQLPDGELCLYDVEDGELRASTRLSAQVCSEQHGVYTAAPNLPPMVVLADNKQRLSAIDLRTGQPRWGFRAHGKDPLQLARMGRVLCVTSGDGTVDALDLATGEVVWRFGVRERFCLRPTVCRDVVIAVAGEPRGGAGTAYGIGLFSGKRLWRRELPAAPSADPVAAGTRAVVPCGRQLQAKLLALEPETGEVRFTQADPGLDNGGQAIAVDDTLIVNTPSGRVVALDLEDGRTRWTRALSNPLTDDVPRQLTPQLRQGALFVPSAQVHVLRPHDGGALGKLGCDLVPDCLRVDERGWVYVAEESGHLSAFAAAPLLSLVK